MRYDIQDSYERAPISETTRTLLCVFAAGDPKRTLPHLDADWEQVFQGVSRNALIGLTHYYLEHSIEADYPPPEFRRRIQQAYRAGTIRMAQLYKNIGRVLEAFQDHGINALVVKGPALAYGVYPDPTLRTFNDLDVLARERDWTDVYSLMLELGFHQGENLPQPPPKLIPPLSPYESKYWQLKTGFLVEVHYDDLYNVGLASRDVAGFWNRAVKIDIEGMQIQVPSLADQLIHECMHAHYHGYTRLNWFSDLAFIVRDQAHRLDWDCMIETVHVEEAQVGVYYSLYFLERLLGISVPKQVLAAVRPDGFRRWWHERYVPEHQALSLQPMARPDFSFYFTPLFKRLIPDLLIMGRRREKFGYLSRLLIPPKAWLIYYYQIADNRFVLLHYFLHPLKLIWHYLVEIVRVILRR